MDFTEIDCILKSINGENRLNYFKRELLKILDEKERQEERLSKSIDDYFNEINKSIYGSDWIIKGKLGQIGEVRTWKDGKKYKKMPSGNGKAKWVRVYDKESRGAKLAIAALRHKIDACNSSQELLNLVLQNKERFSDDLGRPLPIVQELSKYVSAKNDKLIDKDEIEFNLNSESKPTKKISPDSKGSQGNTQSESKKTKDAAANKEIKIDKTDFPEEFNKGKWKKQTEILLNFVNSAKGDSTVKNLYKKLGELKDSLPFKIKGADKKFSSGSFSLVCDRQTMKPEEQRLFIEDITDESEDLKKSSCMKALHEIMHMIDFSCRDDKNSPDYLSNSNKKINEVINNTKISNEDVNEVEEQFKTFREQEHKIILSLNEKAKKIKELNRKYDNNEITSSDEYTKKYREVSLQYANEKKKVTELRAQYIEVSQYSDILDAISEGNLHDSKEFAGHGKLYYRKESRKANEIVANYAALLVSGSLYAERLKKNYPELAESVYNLYKNMLER